MPKITGTADDREQIRELYARYALTIDNLRFEEWVNCFTADGVFESPVYGTFAGHAALRAFTGQYRDGWGGGRVRHMMVNVSFDVDGDVASGACNLIYFSIKAGVTTLAAVGGYTDTLRKENGEWRFTRRKVFIDE